jgi:predicted phosphodiesterase
MRLAVFSDVHGNVEALQAVLADLEALGGADEWWCLGDLAAFGPNPAECIQAIQALPNLKVIQGNTDRYLTTGVRPSMPTPDAETWPKYAVQTLGRDQAFTWTLERLAWPEFEYLAGLKTDLSLELAGYGWAIGFHAIPGDDEGMALNPASEAHLMRDALLDREGSLAFGGHTHLAMDRDLGDWRIINPGSVGFPFDGDPRAAYALVSLEEGRLSVDLRRVDYDREAVIAKLEAADHPMKVRGVHRLRTGQP